MVSQEVPQIIIDLVENFKENEHIYKSANYDEENTKVEFINPFFEALGWDVNNKNRASPRFKEVVFEDTIKIGGKAKAPDYSFRLGGQRIFFVEAKKPSVNIDTDKNPAYQIRRYGWSAKLPLCILTDFEELAVYETTTRPDKNQNASIGRIKYYKYTEYIDKWDEIYNIFSKEAVLSGKFDNYANNTKEIKKGTSEVDNEFLKEIDRWRELLARNIALRNPEISIEELNHAVQLTIDRIIFLRMAEDRGIEKYQQLKNLINLSSKNKDEYAVYVGFLDICRKADAKYNSGLFHFTEEKEISLDADNLTPNLKIDDKVFKGILAPMYYPDCPYEFSVISPEILGNVYERFLGKEIRLTPSHKAKIDYKPEVQKAGGIFYTPQHIVKYIVEKTVGEILIGKTPKQVSKLKFLDPACGSGSFLLEVYQYLLDWHLDYYSNLERVPKDVIFTGKDGIIRLTINEKKRIVLNNIYGVDIDSQAVEVTKLSLLLKVLEDQNKDVVEQQQKLFQERALPYLGDNIKCGNSLVGTDILEQESLTMEEISNLNPFDWEEEFSEVFSTQGGFDVIVGNPPYVLLQSIGAEKFLLDYIKRNFTVAQYKIDLYHLFFERSINLLKNGAYFGFITPNPYLMNIYLTNLRKFILDSACIKKIVMISEGVFKNAKVDTSIIILQKDENAKSRKNNKIELVEYENNSNNLKTRFTKQKYFMDDDDFLFNINIDESNSFILRFLSNNFLKLKDIAHPYFGIQTYDKKKFVENYKKDDSFKPCVNGKNIFKYSVQGDLEFVKFSEKAIKSGGKQEVYENEKIFVRQIGQSPIATYDEGGLYSLNTVYNIYSKSEHFDLKFLLTLLNSSFVSFFWRIFFSDSKVLFPKIKRKYLEGIPIPNISLEDQKPFVDLADKMLELNYHLQNTKTPKEKRLLEKQIEITDNKINQCVYKLYGLSDEEIDIIECSLY